MKKRITAVILSILITALIIIPTLSASADTSGSSDSVKLLGDADGDGEVTILDATRIQRWLADLITDDEIDLTAADADEDGEVSILDATAVQRFIAGFDNVYGIGTIRMF